jgi:hypothetical protein
MALVLTMMNVIVMKSSCDDAVAIDSTWNMAAAKREGALDVVV